jgi:hypothetical protein
MQVARSVEQEPTIIGFHMLAVGRNEA